MKAVVVLIRKKNHTKERVPFIHKTRELKHASIRVPKNNSPSPKSYFLGKVFQRPQNSAISKSSGASRIFSKLVSRYKE